MGWFGDNEHLDRGRQMFADQFEPDGSGFLYRKSMKGAAVRVSEAERDKFVEAFGRFQKYLIWSGGAVLTIYLVGLFVFFQLVFDREPPEAALWIGACGIVIAFVVANHWAWNVPARELRGRPALGVARSGAEVRLLMLKKTTYGQLFLAVGAMGALLLKVGSKEDLFAGWNRLWLVFAVFIIVVAGVQAFRKWRLETYKS